jgi:uncharacterized protein
MKNLISILFCLLPILGNCSTSAVANRSPAQGGTFEETSVDFQGKGIVLHGTFTTPPGGAKAIGVLLLSGSGPTDRDGNQPGLTTNLEQQLARGLAEQGISTLRFDKRAVRSYAPLWPKDIRDLNEFLSFDNFIEDARAALRTLQGMPGIISDNCSVAGHSEGGLIASSLSKDEHLKTTVLLSTPGRNMADLLRSQIDRLLTTQKASDAVKAFMLSEHDRIVSWIVSHGTLPPNIPPGLAAFYPASAVVYLQRVFVYQPERDLAKFSGPVLVLNGGSDVQVSPTRDAKVLFDSLSIRPGRTSQKLKIFDGLSHNYKPVSNSSDPGFDGNVPLHVITEIKNWLSGH